MANGCFPAWCIASLDRVASPCWKSGNWIGCDTPVEIWRNWIGSNEHKGEGHLNWCRQQHDRNVYKFYFYWEGPHTHTLLAFCVCVTIFIYNYVCGILKFVHVCCTHFITYSHPHPHHNHARSFWCQLQLLLIRDVSTYRLHLPQALSLPRSICAANANYHRAQLS